MRNENIALLSSILIVVTLGFVWLIYYLRDKRGLDDYVKNEDNPRTVLPSSLEEQFKEELVVGQRGWKDHAAAGPAALPEVQSTRTARENRSLPPRETHPGHRIVTAANRLVFPDGREVILLGVRHCCPLMHKSYEQLGIERPYVETQGFVDNKGVFLPRRKAWNIAVQANQILRLVGNQYDLSPNQELFSENLH